MRLHLDTAPTVEPLELETARLHRKIDDTADDDLITDFIEAARQLFEQETGRQVITATWRITMDRFPENGSLIRVPRAPLQSVSSIAYLDSSGVSQTWSSSEYTVKTYSGPFARHGEIYPAPDYTYPCTYPVPNAVTITLVAGYGDAATDVPQSVRATIETLLGDLYENREEVITETMVQTNPAFERLLARFRLPVFA